MIVKFIYSLIFSMVVASLLISFDLFTKRFQELSLPTFFVKTMFFVLFISQTYFVISFSLNSVGFVSYEYVIALFIFFFGTFKERYFLIPVVPMITIIYFWLINRMTEDSLIYYLIFSAIVLVISFVAEKIKQFVKNDFLENLMFFIITIVSPFVTQQLFSRRNYDFLAIFEVAVGSIIILSVWKYYLRQEEQFGKNMKKMVNDFDRDYLTGLKNFRRLYTDWEQIIEDNSEEINVVMIDIDFFKQINDTYGHTRGNQVLTLFSTELTQFSDNYFPPQTVDIYRFGGEEFSLIIRKAGTEEVLDFLSQLQAKLASTPFMIDDVSLTIYFSAGVASNNESLTTSELLSKSDEALYQAKKSGRNRIVVYQSEQN